MDPTIVAMMAQFLDWFAVFAWFLVGAYCVWPDEWNNRRTQAFGYGVVGLVVLRVMLLLLV